MALSNMVARLVLEVPGLTRGYAKTLLNEALTTIYDMQMWSWQLQDGGWLTPGLQFPQGPGNSQGSVTVTPFSNIVVGDATASALWAAYVAGGNNPPFTSFQFRNPTYSLYNIVGMNITLGGGYGQGGFGQGGYGQGGQTSVSLILDRPWMEPAGTGQPYMIYQAYFPVPVSDFKRFLAARDTTDNYGMDYWSKTQMDLAVEDPQRQAYDLPSYFVPYRVDQRPGSSTLGNMLYELWPHPLSVLPYSFSFLRRGPQLNNLSDTVPYPLTEEALLWEAKVAACLWKEMQKGEEMQRGSGADWRFAAQAAEAEFKKKLKPIKDTDDALVNLYMTTMRRDLYHNGAPFATTTGMVNVGRM